MTVKELLNTFGLIDTVCILKGEHDETIFTNDENSYKAIKKYFDDKVHRVYAIKENTIGIVIRENN